MKKMGFIIACIMGLAAFVHAADAPAIDWQDTTTDTWHGFPRHRFIVDGCAAWVVTPPTPAPGNPWVWCMEFPEAFDNRTGVVPLVKAGFYYIHISVGNTYGAPSAQAHLDAFYKHITAKGLNAKGTLIGVSRGGLYAYGFAKRGPERVVCIYGDAPVCDIKSWPGGKGKGKGSPNDWANLIKIYGFKDEAEALAYSGNPIDESALKPLKDAGIPLIHVVGDVDAVVPAAENTAIVEKKYKELGGTITVFHKPTCDHHPHGLDDPAPVVELIKTYTEQRKGKQP
ncbi:MAG: alpha/beta hydrolase [Kiritimatiellae bacterium]|nr:alpha/beta hydrolase [Kiritimatiellia bacterium]